MDVNARGYHSAPQVGVLGDKLRVLRGAARLTLQQLSKRTGISVSTLSKIENGQLSPTYEKIAALASGLDVEVGELFRGPERPAVHARRSVTYRDQGVFHRTRQYEYEVLHSDLVDKRFIPLVTTIKAHETSDFSEHLRHDGEEFIYVMSGTAVEHTDCYAPLRLSEGDSCYFDSTMCRAIVSGGPDDAKVLWVCSQDAP